MLYLRRFDFPDPDDEFEFRRLLKQTCFDTVYPFHVLSARGLRSLEFEPITLLYGGNGCGKTTTINVMAEKLGLQRDSMYNRSNFFERYTALCDFSRAAQIPAASRVITSDDVFDFMLDLRALNAGIDQNRAELMKQYFEDRDRRDFRLRSLDDYDELKRINSARRLTQSKYVRAEGKDNVREQSNGESALMYFQDRIREDALYMLDEPENSLSVSRQIELAAFIEESARFFKCQFIIATHSPFLLAMREARVYDMDQDPVAVRPWTELGAVRAMYDFFDKHRAAFERGEK